MHIRDHLKEYKRQRLGVLEDGEWNGKKYGHILPSKLRAMNLIDAGFLQELQRTMSELSPKIHRGFAHLNSSQALAFNLFVPLVAVHKLEDLLGILRVEDHVRESCLEHVEIPLEGTNFDFYIRGEHHAYYFEVKYTEESFGRATADANHREKYRQVYEPLLRTTCSVTENEFFARYQLWRNISYSADGIVVFVFPKFRIDLAKKVESARQYAIHPDNIKTLYVDDVVEMACTNDQARLNRHFNEFTDKYLNIDGI